MKGKYMAPFTQVEKEHLIKESHNPYMYVTNEDEFYSVLHEQAVPYLIVDKTMKALEWTKPILKIANIDEQMLVHFSLVELSQTNTIISYCLDLLIEALELDEQVEDDIQIEDKYIQFTALPLCSNNKICLVIEDCSLQKRYDDLITFHQQLEVATHIAAGVAHELRNPLSVIKGFLQLGKLTEDFNKYYDTVMSELNRMNEIIDDFLSVSRKKIERHRQLPTKLLDSLLEIIKAECLLYNIELTVDLMETDRFINVNESMIKQVILNLLRNSIEALTEEEHDDELKFKISSFVDHGFYKVYIEDNGIGIPEEKIHHIEKTFYTTKEKGTGIGLPLSRRIIEDHGGTFELRSKYKEGTAIIISLPLE